MWQKCYFNNWWEINNIDYVQRGKVGVFRFKKLTVDGNRLEITGTRALARSSRSTA